MMLEEIQASRGEYLSSLMSAVGGRGIMVMVFMIRVARERVGEIESLVVSRSKRYGDEVPHKIWVM